MENLLLLHGAIGSKEDLQPLERILSIDFNVHSINFHGHGGIPLQGDFSIELFAEQVLEWMQLNQFNSINILGYSLGGYVGLYLGKNYPGKVKKIVTLGTKLYWDVSVAQKEMSMLNPDAIMAKVPAFADTLEKRHSPYDWKIVLSQTASMLKHMGQFNPVRLEDYRKIKIPVLLIIGDRDRLVTFVETTTVFKELSKGQLAVLPSTPHAIEQVDAVLVASLVRKFLSD